MRLRLPDDEEPELSISPLIDMTFLLLIYFICTCSLVTPEADLGIRLPGMVAQAESVDMPDEQIIEVRGTGQVFLNDLEFDSATSQELPQLVTLLRRYKAASAAAKNPAMVTIMADGDTPHQRVIDVMNACAAARIKDVSFAGGD
ncbi:MAG: biopolymer transporter ExbD [Kiritimatiellae bacterium]|nr:biopolymer transporter ExbD [Kiritimatiellia bacterium]